MSNDYYKNLPKKRMASGVLFLNKKQEILILKTTYKEAWTIPGGVIEENESPRQAALREVKEELDIDISDLQLLCVDYTTKIEEKSESLQFVFFGGVLDINQISQIRLQAEEISEYKFLKAEEALPLLNKSIRKRLPFCLDSLRNNTKIYLENGMLG